MVKHCQLGDLNPRYTFDRFIVGPHNNQGHRFATLIAGAGDTSNSLLLQGDSGLGKTHLLQAIGNESLKRNPDLSVRYLSCRTLVEELVESIRGDQIKLFRERYRRVCLLLIDDIQFLEGRTSTQEELCCVFDAGQTSGQQLVVATDRSLEPPVIESRHLLSRVRTAWIATLSPKS